jgi:hypothetical protein
MRESHVFFSPVRYIWLLFILLLISAVYCVFKPFVLSVDSAYGFLAYKGTLFFHQFNVVQDIPTTDISQVRPVFISWWSPGQWIYPGLLNYLFNIRLGVAAIWVTLASVVIGFAGYYRIFTFYKFSYHVTAISLLMVFSSSTFYYCFITYQGGEVLEFATFPWFLLYIVRIQKISLLHLLAITLLFALCFIAKTTLLAYCTLALIARVFQISKISSGFRMRFSFPDLWLFLPAAVVIPAIYKFYLLRGPRPTLIWHFGLSAADILVPLTSPLASLLSIQEWIERATKIFSGSLHGTVLSNFMLTGFYLILLAALVFIFKYFIECKKINPHYKSFFFVLYAGLSAFFIFTYSFNGNIDFSSRHFKLLGYMFVPGIVTVVTEKIRPFRIQLMVILFCLVALTDIFYLKGKWTKDRYLSINYYYRNSGSLGEPDKLDQESYRKLIDIDRYFGDKSRPVIFFVESTGDVAIDLHHPFILETPADNMDLKVYQKSGPPLVICISKSTLSQEPALLQSKFPEYRNFEKIGETSSYLFFLLKSIKFPIDK